MEKFIPSAPLFRDPIYDGAADPTIIWNHLEEAWWICYTNRRALSVNIGVSYVHGTEIGIISSKDNGKTWTYRGTLPNLEFESGRNTFWAPEIIYAQDKYHMYCSYVQGIPIDWNCNRSIIHYTSDNLWDWEFHGEICLSSNRVIDACVYEIENGLWKMWYKDEENHSYTYAAISKDLYKWEVIGAEILDRPHEGPNVFEWKEYKWMITDPWEGLGVYKSFDFKSWEKKDNILKIPGTRTDDGFRANHADIIVCNDKAYIFYFVHPELSDEFIENSDSVWEYKHRRTSLQVAELEFDGETIRCNRNKQFNLELDR